MKLPSYNKKKEEEEKKEQEQTSYKPLPRGVGRTQTEVLPAPEVSTPTFQSSVLNLMGLGDAPLDAQQGRALMQTGQELMTEPEINDWAGRNEMIGEYRGLQTAQNMGATDAALPSSILARQAEQSDRMHELRNQLEQGDIAAGNGPMSYSAQDRTGSVLAGTGMNIASGLASAAGTAGEAVARGQMMEQAGNMDQAMLDARFGEDTTQKVQEAIDAAEADRGRWQKITDAADRLGESATAELNKAKNGLSKLGQAGVDISENLLEMGFDVGAAAVTGAGSLVPMFARTFGSAASEARKDGASLDEQILYGTVKGGIEVLTEKMFDGLAGIYGKGAADDVVEKAIGKLAKTSEGATFLRLISSGAGEGVEEFVSGILEPLASAVYKDVPLNPFKKDGYWSNIDREELLYSVLIGAAIGALGGGASIATGQNARANAELGFGTAPTVEAAPEVTAPEAPVAPTVEAAPEAAPEAPAQPLAQTVNRSQANKIINDPTRRAAFEEESGLTLPGRKSEAAQMVMDYYAQQAAETAPVETAPETTPEAPVESAPVETPAETAPEAPTENVAEAVNPLTQTLLGETPEEVRSQSEANTIQAIDEQVGAPDEVRNPLYYTPQTEAESVARARDYLENGYNPGGVTTENSKLTDENRVALQSAGERLGGGYAQAIADMQGAPTWTTVQQDMSTMLLDALADDARETGNWDAYEAWRIVDQEHGTEIARTLQSRGKRTRGIAQEILEAASDAADSAGLSASARNEVLTKTAEFADQLQAIEEAPEMDAEALRDLILRVSESRGTGTIIKGNLAKLLAKQDAGYLAKIAEAQCKALANDYVPSSVGDKIKTWQTIAQLLKLTTFERNIGGNSTFGFIDTLVNDTFGVALDRAVSKKTDARSVGFDSRWLNSTQRKAAVDAMQKSMLEIALDVDMGSVGTKYDPRTRSYRMSGNAAERFMSRLSQILSYSLSSSDAFFRGGIEAGTTETLNRLNAGNEAALSQVGDVAADRADYMLFQNKGKAAKAAQGFHDTLNTIAGVGGEMQNGKRTGGFGLGDVVIPYATVPTNLAIKPFEYSPLGIVKGGIDLANVMKAAKNGDVNLQQQHKAVMEIARGVTGLPVALLFASLIRSGAIKRSNDDDDYDVTKARQSEGLRETQWNLDATLRWLKGGSKEWQKGDDLVSLNWAEPLNAFMDIGALLADAQDEGDVTLSDYLKNYATGSIQAAMEMPLVDSLQSAVNAMRYVDSDNMLEKLGKFGESYATSAATGMLPGIMAQVGRAIDPVTRDTSADTFPQRFANAILNATPIARERLPEKLDSFGNPIKNENPLLNTLNNLSLPGAVAEYAPSDVVQALDDVYKATGKSTFYPDYKPPASFEYGGKDYTLTTEEKRTFQETFGQSYNKLMQSAINNKLYNSMTDEEKAVVFGKLRTMAISDARRKIVTANGGTFNSDTDNVAKLTDPVGYYAMSAMYGAATKDPANRDLNRIPKILQDYSKLPEDVRKQLDKGDTTCYLNELYDANQANISARTFFKVRDTLSALKPLEGKSSVAGWQQAEAIAGSKLTEEEKDYFMSHHFKEGASKNYTKSREAGYSAEAIAAFYRLNNTIESDKNAKGQTIRNSKKNKVIKAAMEYGFTKKQADWLYKLWN